MPELHDVACHFDDISVSDAYTGTPAFFAQFSTFDESSPDGSISKKRTMTVKPGTAIPARRALTLLGETWLVGDGNSDGIFNRAIRTAYWMKKSAGLASVLTPAQACLSQAGVQMHVALDHDSNQKIQGSTFESPQFELSVAKNEAVQTTSFVLLAGNLYHVRTTYVDASGFKFCCSDTVQLPTAISIVTGKTYNPVTDTSTEVVTNTFGIYISRAILESRNLVDEGAKAGDLSLVTPVQPAVGTTLNGGTLRVLSVQPFGDAYLSHVRKV